MAEHPQISPIELINRLRTEHQDSYVYRGERKLYPKPQWPSLYRTSYHSENSFPVEPQHGIRGIGGKFRYRFDCFRGSRKGLTEEEYQEEFKKHESKTICMKYVRNALGYPLAESMFQQAGWTSEGIDVTHDPTVAMTFAMASSWEAHEPSFSPRPDPFVIYRYCVDPRPWSFNDLRRFNFLTCPTFIPTRQICRLFRKGSSVDFHDSIEAYQKRIDWRVNHFDLDEMSGSRPFEEIYLPESWANESRIERQAAGLILPDMLRLDLKAQGRFGMLEPDAKDQEGNRVRVADCMAMNRGRFVEDISEREGVELFFGDMSSDVNVSAIESQLYRKLLPPNDTSFDILANWVRPYFNEVTRWGTLPIDLNMSSEHQTDPLRLWEVLAEEAPERQLSN